MRRETKARALDPLDAAEALLKRVRDRGGRWSLWLIRGRAVFLRDFESAGIMRGAAALLVGTYDERALPERIALDVVATVKEAIAA
jgi:hypothetical protein